jgi:hypothetical protein
LKGKNFLQEISGTEKKMFYSHLPRFHRGKFERITISRASIENNVITFRLFKGKNSLMMNKIFGYYLEKILITQINKYWLQWGNRISQVIRNHKFVSVYEIIEMKFEAIFEKDNGKILLKRGINRVLMSESQLKGGWHLITVKFFETRIFLRTKRSTKLQEIYVRVGNLLNVNPKFLQLNAIIYPNGIKMNNISPDVRIVDGTNRVTMVKVELCQQANYDIEVVKHVDDYSQVKDVMINNQMCEIYKYVKVKSLKRIIVFNEEMQGQWPDIHDAGNGRLYDDELELDEVGAFLMLIWYMVKIKRFKLKLEGTIQCSVEENKSCNIKELTKKIKEVYGLAKDCVITDNNGLVFHADENAIQYKKE